jgi:hypothetical protein
MFIIMILDSRGIGKQPHPNTVNFWEEIVECLSPSPGRDQHRGIFADRLLGGILGLSAITLSTNFLPSL